MIKYLSIIILLFSAFSCQQDITNNEDSPIIPLSEQIDFNTIYIMGDLLPFQLDSSSPMNQSSTNESVYYITLPLTIGNSYSMYYSFNNNFNNLILWSGKDRGVEIYNPNGEFQNIPKTRPRKITFSVTLSKDYTIHLNLDTMEYGISSLSNIINENSVNSIQFLSSRYSYINMDSWNPYYSENNMTKLSSDYYAMFFTNLVPGQSLNFKFTFNTNQYDSFTKDPFNPYTTNNKLVDSQINNNFISTITYLTNYITSEYAAIYFSPTARRYSIEMNNTPMHGDGYLDRSFYGIPILTNTNANPIIKNVYMKDKGSATYIAVDASLKRGVGLPYSGGLQFVLLIDIVTNGSGVSGNFSLYPGMPNINIVGSTVEYILILEAKKSEKSLTDGTSAIERGARLIGPLYTGITYDSINNSERTLPTLSPGADYGYFSYSDIYEIVIPKKYSPNEYTSLNVLNYIGSTVRVCAISWNVGTAWGNLTNTGFTIPIADSIPYTPSSTDLIPSASWPTL